MHIMFYNVYRDLLGNISTSAVSYSKERYLMFKKLELQFRYPLFGGWKTSFYMGYTVPVDEYIIEIFNNTSVNNNSTTTVGTNCMWWWLCWSNIFKSYKFSWDFGSSIEGIYVYVYNLFV